MQSKENGKYQKKMCKDVKEAILTLHRLGKTNVEIGKVVSFSNSAVRGFLIKSGLKSNKIKSKLVEVNCQFCNKVFMPKYHGRDKSCSPECTSELIRRSKIKYTQEDIDTVIKYKERKFTNTEIEVISKVDINKIKEIVRNNKLFLSPEDAQKNAYKKKLEINPNCMVDMRETRMSCTDEEFNIKMNSIIENLDDSENNYSRSYLCDKFGLNLKSIAQGLRHRGRSDLVKPSKTSAGEDQVADLVRECVGQDVEIIRGDRNVLKPKELDIYIPSMKLAIEYCGIYWHNQDSPTPRGRNYHYDKMKACEAQGIRLITIFSDDWEDRNEQVRGFLTSIVGEAKKRVFARKCEIREVEKKLAKDFLDKYHIQGKTTFKVSFGLYYENELLGIVTGNGHHRQKGNDAPFVLNRLVFKKDTLVVGGAGKLLKYLINYAKEKGYPTLISWSDSRWSQGNVYRKTNFSMVEELKPDYSYVVGTTGKRQSKQSNKKKCLLKKGAIGTMENTELELSKTLDLHRIFDCGKKRWSINLS